MIKKSFVCDRCDGVHHADEDNELDFITFNCHKGNDTEAFKTMQFCRICTDNAIFEKKEKRVIKRRTKAEMEAAKAKGRDWEMVEGDGSFEKEE